MTHLFYGQDLKLCWQWQFYQLCLHPRCLGIPNSQLPTPSSAHMWSHMDLLHEDFPGGRRHLYWLFLVASVISNLLWDEEQVPSPFGQGPMAAQRPKPIPQAVGHETCQARRCGVWPRGDTRAPAAGAGTAAPGHRRACPREPEGERGSPHKGPFPAQKEQRRPRGSHTFGWVEGKRRSGTAAFGTPGGCGTCRLLFRRGSPRVKNGRCASPTAKRCREAARPERGCRSPVAVQAGAPAGPAPAG